MSAGSLCPIEFLFSQVFTDQGVVGSGYQIGTFIAGTTTQTPTYTSASLAVLNANPIICQSNGRLPAETWVPNGTVVKAILYDPTGAPVPGGTFDNLQGINDLSSINIQSIGAAFYPVAGNENANWITDYTKRWGYASRYGFGSPTSTDASNATSLFNAFTSAAGFWPVIVEGQGLTSYPMNGTVAIPANSHVIMTNHSTLVWTNTVGSSTNWGGSAALGGLQITGSNVTIEGDGVLVGPSSGIYTGNEFAIVGVGASRTSPFTNIVVRDVEMYNWGAYAIGLQFVTGIDIDNCHLHNNGYCGIALLSCVDFDITKNLIHDITPGDGGSPVNAYGMNISHISTGYNVDPSVVAGNQRGAVNPFCIAGLIQGNTVYNVPVWAGISCHGGFDIDVIDNHVYNCYIPIQVSSSSGNAINYAGDGNKVIGNHVYYDQIDGTASTVHATTGVAYSHGITINGGSTVAHGGPVVTANTIIGGTGTYSIGDAVGYTGHTFAIEASYVQGAVITGNYFRNTLGVGVYGAFFDGTISNNTFGPTNTAANSECIHFAGNNGRTTVTCNVINNEAGNTWAIGFNMTAGSTVRSVMAGNDFSQATTPYGATAIQLSFGNSEVVPTLLDTTGGSHTVDIGPLGPAPRVVVLLDAAGVATITSALNPQFNGQQLVFEALTAHNYTFDNSGNFVLPSGSQVVTQNGTISFTWNATNNKWNCTGVQTTNS